MTLDDESVIEEALARLDLEQQARLLTGADFWSLYPEPAAGLRSMIFSDGPSGVRGARWDEREPSLNLPSATALAASWDPELAYGYGEMMAREARRKGVDVVLGPTINLHRSPLGGRHFEAYSEDPQLTAALAVGVIRGLQEHGIGACPKHYVANDAETERFTVSIELDERALRELYLPPFEQSVIDGGAWTIMAAYNTVRGVTMTESDLLRSPLCVEWGFDGVVVSDWTAARSLDAARARLDLVMPGPKGPWGQALVDAVKDGTVPAEAVADKVRRILRLAHRVGALAGTEAAASADNEPDGGVEFARRAAARGMVLVRNHDNLLPLSSVESVAVIGQAAATPRTQGGGSATVLPAATISPLDAIRETWPAATVSHRLGALVDDRIQPLPLESMHNPATGEPGIHVEILAADGQTLGTEERRATQLLWFGNAPKRTSRIVLSTEFTPSSSGALEFGVTLSRHSTLQIDGQTVIDVAGSKAETASGDEMNMDAFYPDTRTAEVDVRSGATVRLDATLDLLEDPRIEGFCTVTLGIRPVVASDDALIAEAARAAGAAEVAVVVVGTTDRVESEGFDRTTLALPGRQDDLVEAVAAANPNTIVVVNAGSPVLLPWRERVAAVLLTWFGGQEYGHALADVLTGAAEPTGRLPTTWPAEMADVPVLDVTPTDGVLCYDEGIHIGYRAWQRAGRTPAYPFGFGLGYTSWSYEHLDARPAKLGAATVEVTVRNVGTRAGRETVQVYLSKPDSAVDRPRRWLAGFAGVEAEPGQTVKVTIPLRARLFEHWDETDGGWVLEPGAYTIEAGRNVDDLDLQATLTQPSPG